MVQGTAGLNSPPSRPSTVGRHALLLAERPMLDANLVQATRLLLAGNDLSGPAFPASWVQPGALPGLEYLQLSDNPGLVGSLPASLPWPRLIEL